MIVHALAKIASISCTIDGDWCCNTFGVAVTAVNEYINIGWGWHLLACNFQTHAPSIPWVVGAPGTDLSTLCCD
jgi:hypothetical protein